MTDQVLDRDADLDTPTTADRGLGWLLTIGGAIGVLCASILLIEKINLLKEPDKSLSCDINPFVSCGSVINTDQASAFGFPNPLMGVAGFAVVATLGVLMIARVKLPEFVWIGLQAGTLFGIAFVTWLQYQSIYDIRALCPYCMVVWSVMIPIFVFTSARNLRWFIPDSAVTRIVSDWTLLITILWYVAVAAAIWFQFGSDLWAGV
jgi:uncharacterized membrane protein